jgi:hypothetical protein
VGPVPKKRSPGRRPQDPFTRAIDQFLDNVNQELHQALQIHLETLLNTSIPSPPPRPAPPPRQAPPRSRPPASKPTLYDLLEVSPKASTETINAAYKSLAKRHHPDKGGDVEKMKRLTVAHHILSDPKRRAEYDRLILNP